MNQIWNGYLFIYSPAREDYGLWTMIALDNDWIDCIL